MDKELFKDSFGWGFLLWLIGYILGFLFFAIVPPGMIGWVIMPFGILITLWVLFKKIKTTNYLFLSIVWTLIAIVFDYVFIVKLLKPTDGYYKLDVFIYYTLTFILPLIVGWKNLKKYFKIDKMRIC